MCLGEARGYWEISTQQKGARAKGLLRLVHEMRANSLGRCLPEMTSCALTLISPIKICGPVLNHAARGEDD